MNDAVIFVIVVGLFSLALTAALMLAFGLGWALSNRNFQPVIQSLQESKRDLSEAAAKYDYVVNKNTDLTSSMIKMQAQYNQAIEEIARLSAELAVIE